MKVLVEMHPGGASEFRRTLATMTVINVPRPSETSDYDVTITETSNFVTGSPPKVRWHRLHDRNPRQSVWKLLIEAIAGLDEDISSAPD